MISTPKTILIANIRLIGDVILTTPLIGLLSEAYPDASIDMLVNPGTGEFLERDPRVRRVIYSKCAQNGVAEKRHNYQLSIFRSYDLAINMNASDRGNIASVIAGNNVRVGFYSGDGFWKNIWQRLLLTHPVRLPTDIPVARYCQVVAQTLEIPCSRLTVRVFWSEADKNHMRLILDKQGVSGPFFVVHPFARWIYKYWDIERFCEVSDALFEQYGIKPVWTSSSDRHEVEQICKAQDRCRHKPALIKGELNLNQIACLLDKADFYLGLDTAITHLAASVDTPMVALYGPTFTSRWFPWYNHGPVDQSCPSERGLLRRGSFVIIQSEKSCVPCGKAGCDDSGRFASPCLQEISTDEVLAAVNVCMATKELNRRTTLHD